MTTPRLILSPDGRELDGLVSALPGRMLGIVGAPGSGKSTLASTLMLGRLAALVPMDGFHLDDVELRRRGLHERKGAPETFDAEGYAALLARIAARPDHIVMAPEFDRSAEQSVAGRIPVRPDVPLVVTEGNYLLLDEPRWREVRRHLDAVWHVRVDERLRNERLVARHVRFGKSPEAAQDWVDRVDAPNASLVEAAAHRADLLLDLTSWQR